MSQNKPKFTPSLNIYSMTKAKDITQKIKTVNLNQNGITTLNKQNNKIINKITTHNIPNSLHNNPTQNSFRKTGIISVKKFKTTKTSPEKFIDRNFSGDKSKLMQNFMKNSISNSVQLQEKETKQHTDMIEEQNEMSDNLLDHIHKKLNKTSQSKLKTSTVLNSTNPIINSSNLIENLMIGKYNQISSKPTQTKIKNNNSNLEDKKMSSPRVNKIDSEKTNSKVLLNANLKSNLISKNNSSMKKTTEVKTPNNNIQMNKMIKNITTTHESLLNNLKSKNEKTIIKKDNILIHSTNIKNSMTTPVTNKNSRKNSIDKIQLKLTHNNNSNQIITSVNSNYTSNNNNTSSSNLQSKPKMNYEEINLMTENSSKKTDKIISTSTGSIQSTVKAPNVMMNILKNENKNNSIVGNINTTNNSKSNSLAGSQNLNPNINLQIFDLVKGNLIKNTPSQIKKKTQIGISMPITNQSSKGNSKNNSKSRIDEKSEPVKKPIISNNINKNIITSSHHPIAEKFKKHLTSTNSPTHFPFNFNKESLIGNKLMQLNKTNINTSMKEKNQNSITNHREEAVTINHNKKVISLNIGSSNNSVTNPIFSKNEKLSIISTHPNTKDLNLKLKLNTHNNITNINNIHNKINNIHKQTLIKNTQNHSNIHSTKNEVEMSLESVLNNSTSSVKSTVRESNYYKREAEKISNYIIQFYNTHKEYPISNLKFYKFGRLLGRGAFGKVNLCLHTLSGRLVSIKSFNKNRLASESAKRKIYQETNLMKNLKHNSIVKIYEVFESQKYILIVMEYISGGDLLSFVRKRTKLNETTAKYIFRQIIEAIQYIHQQKIVHRDIKLDNILIDLNNTIKICDFGVSKQITGELLNDQCGTPAYIAPEILLNHGYEGFPVDVWSAGVVLYAMLSGTVPFKATNMTDLHRLILSGQHNLIKDISTEASDLVDKILEVDPTKRLTTDQILNHEWLKSTDDIFNGKIKSLSKLNLFANAERVLLSKFNIDYRNANKDDLIENFTLKNIDTNQESENQNIATKSCILAPFNSSFKNNVLDTLNSLLKIENSVLKFYGKAKDANRNYELNNNGEIDNGIIINQINVKVSLDDDIINENLNKSNVPSSIISKQVSKPISPNVQEHNPNFNKEDTHRNARKNQKDFGSGISTADTFVLDENIVKTLEILGYKKDYLMKCLYYNELNYATATYNIFLNSSLD